MEHKSSKKISASEFVQKNLAVLFIALGGLLLAVLVLAAVPGLYAVGWHYAACFFLVVGCWLCRKLGRQKLAMALVVLTCVVAVAGFFLVYAGPFAQSGKTMGMYIGRYGLFTLPIFLFPCIAGLIAAWSGEH